VFAAGSALQNNFALQRIGLGHELPNLRNTILLHSDQVKSALRREQTVDLSQERIRHLHAVDAAGPRPGNASAALCSVELVVACWHVRWVEHEDIDRVREAACQRTNE